MTGRVEEIKELVRYKKEANEKSDAIDAENETSNIMLMKQFLLICLAVFMFWGCEEEKKDSLAYEYPNEGVAWVHSVTSMDGRLRIYSWKYNEPMHHLSPEGDSIGSVAVYYNERGKVTVDRRNLSEVVGSGDDCSEAIRIYMANGDHDRPIYLIEMNTRACQRDASNFYAMRVEGDSLAPACVMYNGEPVAHLW